MKLYQLLQPVLLAIFKLFSFVAKRTPFIKEKTRKLWKTLEIRRVDGKPTFLKIDPVVFNGVRPIWIHAASGEFEYAKSVIREIVRDDGPPIVVTYFSPTYALNVQHFPGVQASAPLPLDSMGELEDFLNHIKPRALLIARTDTWPNTISATATRKIPILLFSATFHSQSKRLRGLSRSLAVATLNQINDIQCVSDDDKTVLTSLGIKNVEVCGDTRFDQVLERLKAPKALPEGLRTACFERVFVAGSVWREDLQPSIEASVATFSETPHTLLIVPHEPTPVFIEEIEILAHRLGIAKALLIRMSELTAASHNVPYQIIIVDSVGLLAELYALGQIAFVGGSFRKTVHSVMEPLAAGCLTVVGPRHTNNREAIEFQHVSYKGISLVTAVNGREDFTRVLRGLWTSIAANDFKENASDYIRKEVANRGGATAKVLQWLVSRNLMEH